MNNDIVTKARLNAALGTEGNMGFEHNDIVTVDKMNEAIAEGGGGSIETAEVTFSNAATDGSSYDVFLTFQTFPITVSSTPVTIELPIYEGGDEVGVYYLRRSQILGDLDTDFPSEITGSVIEKGNGFIITGDGTITLKTASDEPST